MTDLGLIQVYTGAGKGKTTAAVGAGLRAVGHGLRVHMIQFLKGGGTRPFSGELRALEQVQGFSVEQFGTGHFVYPGVATERDRDVVRHGLKHARHVIASADYDLVILDELNVALQFELLAEQDVVELMDRKPAGVELVITGRGAPQAVLDRADLVTEMQEVKHPFTHGRAGRCGIDF